LDEMMAGTSHPGLTDVVIQPDGIPRSVQRHVIEQQQVAGGVHPDEATLATSAAGRMPPTS
jgi:hypothetical protein